MANRPNRDHQHKTQHTVSNAQQQSNSKGSKQLPAMPVLAEKRSVNDQGSPESGMVSQFVKKKSDLAKFLGKRLAAVEKWQKAARLSDGKMDDIYAAGLIEVALECDEATIMAKNAEGDLMGWLGARKLSGDRVKEEKKAPAPPTIIDELEDAGLDRIYGDPISKKESVSDLRAFIALAPANMIAILTASSAGTNRITQVQNVLTVNAGKYPALTALEWAGTYGDLKTAAVLTETATHETSEAYVRNWLAYGLTAASPLQLKQLVRFQALLPGAALIADPAELQRDGKYDKSYKKGKDRTGFLAYTFTDGSIMHIHTHWNLVAKVIYSMHVQDARGANGLEINNWTWFANVKAAVVAGQNAVVPAPTGGPLT